MYIIIFIFIITLIVTVIVSIKPDNINMYSNELKYSFNPSLKMKWLIIILVSVLLVLVVFTVINSLFEAYQSTDPNILRVKNKLVTIFPDLENVQIIKSDSSYTINKKKIYICTEYEGRVYDDNMLVYVMLHEFAHVLCKTIGHGEEFLIIFGSLLNKAEQYKLYDPEKPKPSNYCNVKNTA